MKIIKLFSQQFFICVLLCSCSSTTTVASKSTDASEKLYFDDYFIDYQLVPIESENDVFSIDDEMKDMVRTQLLSEKDPLKRAKKLLNHLFSKENIDLSYQGTANLTAEQAFHSRKANCMSLTIMAYALAKEAKLNVVFQEIKVPEYWVRNNEYNMLTGHVNLLIKRPVKKNVAITWGSNSLQIDFDPFIKKKTFPKKKIDKATILAMFYTNIGSQAIVDGDYTKAYAYLKKATLVSPLFPSSWGNLGILYRMVDNYPLAEKAYRYALTLAPNNLTSLNNLAVLMKKQGLVEEANAIENILHNKRIKNPYYHALLADEAFYRGKFKRAQYHYKNAIQLNRSIHEFYYGLAKVYFQLNEIERAQNALKKAIRLNNSRTTEHQYIAKLNWLRATVH